MDEQDINHEVIRLRYPPEARQHLYKILSPFISAHSGVTLELVETAEEKQRFNQNLVTMLPDPDHTDIKVPVITKNDLHTFEVQTSAKKGRAERLYNALDKSQKLHGHGAMPYYYMMPVTPVKQGDAETQHQQPTRYVFRGIRAEQADDLCAALAEHRLQLHQLGNSTIEFFAAFCEELHKPAEED